MYFANRESILAVEKGYVDRALARADFVIGAEEEEERIRVTRWV